MVSIADIWAARPIVAEVALRTPLVRLPVEGAPAEVYLKLENLQPIGSFKLRGAHCALRRLPPERLARGVLTASAGNMAQGAAYGARRLGVPCTVIAPDTIPDTKARAIERLGGTIRRVPRERWWQTFQERTFPGLEDAAFLHAFDDPAVQAGNGTIGLEILEDLPDVDAVVIPFGGGGLAAGIATALRALKPDTAIYAAEVETAAPLRAAFAAGGPREIAFTPSFVDGIGSGVVFPQMWELARTLLDGALVATLAEARAAIRLLAERRRVIAEGAAACAVAVALSGAAGSGKIVAVVSGGNLDLDVLGEILAERA
ncbi:MAG TPA: pyridoxal-phosphate dependent enzyme [Thermomicrobiales bacterium]|nr:pyridoxal-phosphate dependent enzyme [Thermomicrobiales bacterium]